MFSRQNTVNIKVEPYWNVKLLKKQARWMFSKIKVEPYWNVKPTVSNLYISFITLK